MFCLFSTGWEHRLRGTKESNITRSHFWWRVCSVTSWKITNTLPHPPNVDRLFVHGQFLCWLLIHMRHYACFWLLYCFDFGGLCDKFSIFFCSRPALGTCILFARFQLAVSSDALVLFCLCMFVSVICCEVWFTFSAYRYRPICVWSRAESLYITTDCCIACSRKLVLCYCCCSLLLWHDTMVASVLRSCWNALFTLRN